MASVVFLNPGAVYILHWIILCPTGVVLCTVGYFHNGPGLYLLDASRTAAEAGRPKKFPDMPQKCPLVGKTTPC